MATTVENITIEKGTTFNKIFSIINSNGSAFDLSTYTFSAKIKKWGGANLTYNTFVRVDKDV